MDTFGIIWDMIHSIIYSILRSKKSSVRGFDVKFSEQAQAQSLGSAEHPPECERNLWHQNGFCFFSNIGWGGGGENDPQNSPNMSKFDSNSVWFHSCFSIKNTSQHWPNMTEQPWTRKNIEPRNGLGEAPLLCLVSFHPMNTRGYIPEKTFPWNPAVHQVSVNLAIGDRSHNSWDGTCRAGAWWWWKHKFLVKCEIYIVQDIHLEHHLENAWWKLRQRNVF